MYSKSPLTEMRQLWKVASNNIKEHGSTFVRSKFEDRILFEIIAGKIYHQLLTELGRNCFFKYRQGRTNPLKMANGYGFCKNKKGTWISSSEDY